MDLTLNADPFPSDLIAMKTRGDGDCALHAFGDWNSTSKQTENKDMPLCISIVLMWPQII